MGIIKSFTVGKGDIFYIKHNRSNYTTIDCFLSNENIDGVMNEISNKARSQSITRPISTHPNDGYVYGLEYPEKKVVIANFYCSVDETTQKGQKDSLHKYCDLKDSSKEFYLYGACFCKWIREEVEKEEGNFTSREGVTVLWQDTDNEHFENTYEEPINGESQDRISPIIRCGFENGMTMVFWSDFESHLMGDILEEVDFKKINVLFVSHHKSKSGRLPDEWLEAMDPDIVIIGGTPYENLDYINYDGHNKITQNSAGDIFLDCSEGKVDIYVSNPTYNVTYLKNNYESNRYGCYYIGTLEV